MKPYQFELNDTSMRYEYHRTREGPNFFMCYYKNSAVGRTDPKDAWRTLGIAKFTDTGKALKEWCLQMHEQYGLDNLSNLEPHKDTSFASDAANESERSERLEDPTSNTKMIT